MEILADVSYLKQLKTSYSDLMRIISSVDNDCAQVRTTLNATKSKYSNYSYVVSEVNAISKLLVDLKSTKDHLLTEIKKVEKGLEAVAKLYTQEEKNESNKINMTSKFYQVPSKAIPVGKGIDLGKVIAENINAGLESGREFFGGAWNEIKGVAAKIANATSVLYVSDDKMSASLLHIGDEKLSVGIGNASYNFGYSNYGGDNIFAKPREWKDKDNFKYKKDYVYDRKTGQYSLPELTKFAEKNATILEFEKKVQGEVSIVNVSGKKEGSAGYISGDVKIGTAEAHASVSAGLYLYDTNGKPMFDKDGNLRLAPGVEAKVGASASVLTASGQGRLGSENLNVNANVDIAAGKVAAEAGVTASVFGKDGKLNPQLHASASAEAIAFEAKGRAGVTVLGIDAGVTGSVKVGIGAHADVGIVDGKLKVEVGAALGIGVDIGFDVDVGGAVKSVCGAAKSVWDTVTGWF